MCLGLVLLWINGAGKAEKTAIGYLPAKEAVDTTGLDVSEKDMEELLHVYKDEWLKEVASIREHYANYGEKLPKELMDQLDALEERLKA